MIESLETFLERLYNDNAITRFDVCGVCVTLGTRLLQDKMA